MIVGTCLIELHLGGNVSLKGKRAMLKPLLARLHKEFNVSAAEVDHHDSWQSASIALACVANDSAHVEQVLHHAVQWIENTPRSASGGLADRNPLTFKEINMYRGPILFPLVLIGLGVLLLLGNLGTIQFDVWQFICTWWPLMLIILGLDVLIGSLRTRNVKPLASLAASVLPDAAGQSWLHLATMNLPPFVDRRHTVGTYPAPTGDLATLLDATMACTDLVLVTPVYWYSFPSPLKTYLDHWSAWLRIPGVPFKESMANKRLHLITTSGDEAKAQPMIASARLCAQFFAMPFGGVLWGKGGAPGAVEADSAALAAARRFFVPAQTG